MVFDTVQVSYPQIIMQYIIIKIDNNTCTYLFCVIKCETTGHSLKHYTATEFSCCIRHFSHLPEYLDGATFMYVVPVPLPSQIRT